MKAWLSLLLPLVIASKFAFATEAITWMSQEFPPNYISNGARKGEGYGDQFTKYLINHLNDFDHITSDGTMSRILFQMKNNDGICTAMARRTPERQEYVAY